MTRRDAFTGLHELHALNDVSENDQHESLKLMRQPLDLIPTADLKKKRSRKWEQVHRSETVTYRGIPRQVVDLILEIAQSLSVPRDEVVQAFLEYGVMRYQTGDLHLFAYPKAQRMTLFPEDGQGNTNLPSPKSNNHKWLADVYPVPEKKTTGPNKKKSRKNPDNIPQWELRVTFRIPVQLKESVRSIAGEHTLPVGEIVWFFVMEGVKAFQNGKLLLQPIPKTIGKTLFLE